MGDGLLALGVAIEPPIGLSEDICDERRERGMSRLPSENHGSASVVFLGHMGRRRLLAGVEFVV